MAAGRWRFRIDRGDVTERAEFVDEEELDG
jgi:hypothetical protein